MYVRRVPGVPLYYARSMSNYGRITTEDRRWWLLHLECAPEVTAGTFHAWLDSCGTHTAKKLVERNIWTIEQVSQLSPDQVDTLKYREGCLHMDVVWEHARTVTPALKQREITGGVESELIDKMTELKKKRLLQRQREGLIEEQKAVAERRKKQLEEMKEKLMQKRLALKKIQDKQTNE